MSLLLADGQLAASSAEILGVGTGERIVGLTLFNTSAMAQEIVLTVSRSGGTARQIYAATLEEDESLHISGLPLDAGDSLSGYASGAAAVDYVAMRSSGAFNVLARGANGTPKQSAAISLETTEKVGLTLGELTIVGLLEEIRDIGLQIK